LYYLTAFKDKSALLLQVSFDFLLRKNQNGFSSDQSQSMYFTWSRNFNVKTLKFKSLKENSEIITQIYKFGRFNPW